MEDINARRRLYEVRLSEEEQAAMITDFEALLN
jgi:hypothetical protein